jgi:hypothetical protein
MKSGIVASMVICIGQLASGQSSAPTEVKQVAGTIVSLDASTRKIVIKEDSGRQSSIAIDEDTVLLHISPDTKDLTKATKLTFTDLKTSDHVFVRGFARPAAILGRQVLAMTEGDINSRAQKEHDEWKKNGVEGALVSARPAASEIVISRSAPDGMHPLTIRLKPSTQVLKYADDSARFADARPASLSDMHPGDQVRARGDMNSKGEFEPDVMVFGSFHTIFGKVISVDESTGEIKSDTIPAGNTFSVMVTSHSVIRRVPLRVLAYMIPWTLLPPNVQVQVPPLPAGKTGQDLVEELPRIRVTEVKPGDVIAALVGVSAEPGAERAVALLTGLDPLLTLPPVPGNKNASPLAALTLGLPREVSQQ